MTDLKNNIEVLWIQKGSFGYVVVEGKDSNHEWINRPFQVCSILVLNKTMHEYQKEIESLKLERNEFKKYSITWYGKKNELEQELQKTRDEIEFWKNEYVSHSETMCKCQQELQETREQLEKAENVLKVSVDINVSGWETYRMANQYFKEKDKQGE